MKKLAFIAHPYHRLTQSTKIFDFLSNYYSVEMFYDNRYGNGTLNMDKIIYADIAFYFQTTPFFNHKNLVWCPMYDDNYHIHFPNVKYICFCNKLYRNLHDEKKIYVQYWKKPEEFNNTDKKVIYFWNRKTDIIWENVKKFFLKEKIDKVYFKDFPDPSFPKAKVSQSDIEKYNIQFLDFENEQTYKERLKEVSIIICPRTVEGVGMFMLDGFANGSLVFGYDGPTMNEYIINWNNGILFNEKTYNPLELGPFQAIRKNAYASCVNGYENWTRNIPKIIDFIES